jgi:Transposase DDE domain group 1
MPKGTRKFRFSFEETHITHFGGMWLIQRFCNKLGLRHLLQRYVSAFQKSSNYHPSELILALIFAIIMGLRRINKTDILQYNGAFLEMLGLKQFPDQSTLRRFLKRLPTKSIRQLARLHDSLRAHLFAFPDTRSTLIFDLDSVVIVIYGRAEGARIGYNPKKRGRRSYHPLLCFEAHFQEFWHGTLRPGNTVTSSGVVPFLKVCLAKVPQQIARSRIRLRMDSGFYRSRVIRFLDSTGCGYVMVAKEFPHLKKRARGCKFQELKNGWQVGEFWEKVYHKWSKLHRFVVVRRPTPQDPAEAEQLTLFKDKQYVYQVLVTNLEISAWRVYLFYKPRATIEKNIRELLYDYPLGKIPTETWTANVAFFQILLFAADIVHWFKRLCLPPQYLTTTLDTVRTDFLVLPARLVREHKKNIVKLPHDYHHQKEFLAALQKIETLRLSNNFRFCK